MAQHNMAKKGLSTHTETNDAASQKEVIDVGKTFGVQKSSAHEYQLNIFLYTIYYLLSRFIRVFNWLVSIGLRISGRKVRVVCVGNCRDEIDVRKFGFHSIRDFPETMPWIMFRWNKVWGQIYMIGSITDEIAGDLATNDSIERGRRQFAAAVELAVKRGATTILYAAATKRLFRKGELEAKFPGIIFTLGDNFTGLLLGEVILDAFSRSNLSPKNARVLLVAPYGLLGSVALHYLIKSGCEVAIMGSKKRKDLLDSIANKYQLDTYYSFEDVGRVDMVVACNSAANVRLNLDRVELLRKPGRKLMVIDPNEPYNMTPEAFKECEGKVLRYDAGNGMSPDLKYVLGGLSAWVLRLRPTVIWGCFSEALIIAANRDKLSDIDWYEISPKNIALVKEYFGKGKDQMCLPQPLNYNIPIQSFSIEL